MRLMTVPCVLVLRSQTGADEYGAAVVSEERVAGFCYYTAPVAEERGGQEFQSLTVYLPPDAPITGIAAIEVDGSAFEVDGAPAAFRSPRTGAMTHRTVRVRAGA